MGKTLLNRKGQSTIEYVLLMVVFVSLGMTVFNSQAFQNLFGENSTFFGTVKNRVQFTYRHGIEGEKEEDAFNYGDARTHYSYFNEEDSQSRFFLPLEAYGAN